MAKTYHDDFGHSITSEVIEFTIGVGHLRDQEMTMHTSSRPNTLSWLLHLATRLLAYSLNMPEPLVYDTGVFVFARVQAVENRVGRTLCPIRMWRALLARIQLWRGPP